MLALTGVMVVEKTAPYGARLVAPLGGALVMAGSPSVFTVWAVSADPPGGSARPDGAVDPGMVALLVAAVGLAILWPAGKAGRQWLTGRVVPGGRGTAVLASATQ